MTRPTIADIAQAAGVSSTAVSFALNGRPGVAEPTRERIALIAKDMGWTPNAAARALSTSKVNTLGLIITAPYDELSRDTFFLRFIAGVEKALATTPVALVLKIVENFEHELEAIRQWQAESRVDGVILVNPRPDDPRPALVNHLSMPAVFIGTPGTDEPYSSVYIDDALVMRTLLDDLTQRGSRSVMYLHSHAHLAHGKARLATLKNPLEHQLSLTREYAITATGIEDEREQIRGIIRPIPNSNLPDTIVCEDEDLTLATLAVLQELRISVPGDIGLVSWESTPGLTSRRPYVSTLERSPVDMGVAAVELLKETAPHKGAKFTMRELPCPRLHAGDTLPAPLPWSFDTDTES